MRRVCFQLQVKPGHIDAYRKAHAAVWADMLSALPDTGWHNYSIFLRPDGLVIGYFETEDLQANLDGMASENEVRTSGKFTRSCGRAGPAILGTTVARSKNIVSENSGSGMPFVWNMPCSL